MSFWTAIVVIVAIGAITKMVSVRHKHSHGSHRQVQADQSERETALQHEVEDLRERIQVLEKITVDGREARAIADEIERLRDRQEN
ncbi:MAG: hypothetical protein EP341_11240 [Sphingomonadales bacterium]|nr:MAG: hypothetical protein EP341_11240 [Sphingomonadales bacterium]